MNKVKFSNKSSVNTFLIACCTIFFSPLHAQYDDLLRKSRYTWVAEYTADYELNPLYSETVESEMNLTQIIHLENEARQNGLYHDLNLKYYLSYVLLRALRSGAFACYADEHLTQLLAPGQIEKRLTHSDTVASFDSPRGKAIVVNDLRPEEIDLFRIRQVFYFDRRKKQFGARLLAVAPLLNKTDDEGKVTERTPLLWIKIPPKDNCEADKIARNAAYSVQTFMRGNAPEAEEMKTGKGNLDLKKWAFSEVHKPSHKNLSSDTYDVLGQKVLQSQIYTTDTLFVYDPVDYAETVTVVENNAIDRVEKIRFVQNWYYDERRHRLAMQVVAVAPMAAVRDSEGILRYYRPLFYSKY